MARKDHGDYFDRPIGRQLIDNYRGPDRRDGAAVARWPLAWLLAWPLFATTASGVVWLASPIDLTGPGWAQAALGIVAAGVALAVGRITGRARALCLGSGAALLAVAGAVLPVGAPAAAAGASLVAAYLLASSARTDEVDTHRLTRRRWWVSTTGPVAALVLAAIAEGRLETDVLVVPLRTATLLAWCAAVGLLVVRQRDRRGCAVEARSLHLAAAATTGALLHALASLVDAADLAVAGTVVVATGLGVAIMAMVDLLGAELEARRSHQHLQRAMAERNVGAREAVIREAAHEARNALTGIEAAAWGLRRLATDQDARLTAVIEALGNGIDRLKAIMLPEERTETDRIEVGAVLDPIVWLARGRGTQITVEGDTHVAVACPASTLGQALDNLLINAHLHGDAARHTVHVRVEPDDDGVDIVISDGGPGIPEGLREVIFEPGTRHGASTGEGLGLAVARNLLRAHGGDLQAERPPHGASFRVRLRRAEPVATSAGGSAEEREHQQQRPRAGEHGG